MQIIPVTRAVQIKIKQTKTTKFLLPHFATNLTKGTSAVKLWLQSLSTNQQNKKNYAQQQDRTKLTGQQIHYII
jgi:hypothetical protein